MATEPRDGDVFRFVYSQESWERAKAGFGGSDLNWCFDGQLVFRNGRLCDTYWGGLSGSGEGRTFTVAEAESKGALTYVCNVNEVEKIHQGDFELYAEGDAFNLSHQHGCYKHFVKRIGAKKSQTLMTRALHQKVQAAHEELRSAARNLEYCVARREQLLPRIEAGEEVSI